MFALPGVTPFATVLKSQLPGSSSLLPPVNAESSAFASDLCPTRPAACSACQSASGAASSWFPSAPWNEEPGSGLCVGGNDVPSAGAAKNRPSARTGRTRAQTCRRRERGPLDQCTRGEATRRCKPLASGESCFYGTSRSSKGSATYSAVVAVRRLNQGRFVRRNTLTPEQLEQAADAYRRLGNIREVAAELGLSYQGTHYRLQRAGVSLTQKRRTAEDDEEVRRL